MKKHLSVIYYSMVTVGIVGVIITLGYDFFRPGEPSFGNDQFMGFIGSIIILLAGLRKLSSTENNIWDFASFFIYIAGMLYLVLMPHSSYHTSHSMLKLRGFNAYDFSQNVFGFMPLGYLLFSFFTKFAGKYRLNKTFLIILIIGVVMSLLIEISQYFIPGRYSSLADVGANGLGNILGMLLFLLDRSFTEKVNKS